MITCCQWTKETWVGKMSAKGRSAECEVIIWHVHKKHIKMSLCGT